MLSESKIVNQILIIDTTLRSVIIEVVKHTIFCVVSNYIYIIPHNII
nr:MAG TPA: hypothetical protein [Bacteriophage sp.]